MCEWYSLVDTAEMRMPRVEEWSAVGDPLDGRGAVTVRRIPLHWWLVDKWLAYGHPHWSWWYGAWGRVLPRWGDPLCAAYVTMWSPFYGDQEEDAEWIEVGWDNLPAETQRTILKRLDNDEEKRHLDRQINRR